MSVHLIIINKMKLHFNTQHILVCRIPYLSNPCTLISLSSVFTEIAQFPKMPGFAHTCHSKTLEI